MGEYLRACDVDEVAEGTALACLVAGKPVAVVRSGGDFYAVADRCSHANVALSEGEVEDATIECWLHGSRFDLRTGEPSGLPAVQSVPVYPVTVDGDDVLVDVSPGPSL